MIATDSPKAVVLLSGGLDSTTTLAIAKKSGFAVHAISFSYGQRHQFELEAARSIAIAFEAVRHIVVNIDLRLFGGSVDYSLTSSCYDPSPSGEACAECDSCLLRLKGFAENGVKDPIRYRKKVEHEQHRQASAI